MWFPVLLRVRPANPTQPEQNMLPHTFLTKSQESQEVRGEGKEGGTGGRCMTGKGEGKSE